MKALILAAGRGHRLRPHTNRTPKCLLTIEPGVSILHRQIALLTRAGVDRIIVIAGFGRVGRRVGQVNRRGRS